MATELICFFLLGISALLLNAGFSSEALPLFWLVLPLLIKIINDTVSRDDLLETAKKIFTSKETGLN